MGDWTTTSAGDLGRAIGAGTVDPVALTEAYLDAIATHPAADRIYARLTPDRARAEAAAPAAPRTVMPKCCKMPRNRV
jgi:aspartyl-tRNA(Asn)/glutamyl-tRNA(Gln) amidotransferase subunit A